ncbi:CST complex subunit Ten1 [Dichotomopilus funicola]|uniref:CST complex subunit Ten1 n=1 Tax=Dichotomopilus funicola TaxID=1934379 RepID=A0AAN6ZIN8_9PEZI|nr:CST complex subunit Ten1 [Dichotomopilus funicola]
MSYGPRASQLCLLSSLPTKYVGDKVRFLGCVVSYSTVSGVLALEHRIPGESHSVTAQVDVNMVLQSLGSEQIRTGEWVNVIGYITEIAPSTDDGERDSRRTTVQAQAVLLWSAGPFDLRRYEASIMALEPAGTTRERVAS